MHLTTLLFGGFSLLTVAPIGNAASTIDQALTCGTPDATEHDVGMMHSSSILEAVDSNLAKRAPETISVYVHVVYANTTLPGGYVPDQQINDQIDVLNQDFGKVNAKFVIQKINRVQNAPWFQVSLGDSPSEKIAETEMMNTLHTGSASDLNIYTVGASTSNRGGRGTFPWWYAGAPKLDGVILRYSTLPGGSFAKHNLGKIATHEVGHWLGLYHTFQGGCSADKGDFVSDTNPEAVPATGCPESRDSCPGFPGVDPVHNIMDYTEDACRTEITKGQYNRIVLATKIYRNLTLTNLDP